VSRAGSYLALTEWKLVRSAEELESKRKEALHQAQRYASGSLSALELSRTRYLVLVSEKAANPPDEQVGDVLYRAVNIAISRDSPSVDARKTKSRSRKGG